MLHIAICDDDAWMASKVEALAKIFFRTHCVDIKVQSYQSSENLMYDLQDGVYYDLLLLDIEMPGIDGMGLAKNIHDTMPAARIIFITSHLEYAITAYEFSVFRYIPKTALDDKLPVALEDFYKLYGLERSEYYVIKVKNHVNQLLYRDILYILKDGKYAVFHMRNRDTASVRKTLSQVSEEIGQEYFYFVDRGCIINLANVTGMDEADVIMSDGQHVTVSKGSVAEFKSTLLRFWERQI